MKKVRSVRCPQCGTETRLDAEHFPFCSRRCRLLDLGSWLNGDFRVAGERVDPDALPGRDDDEA